MNSLKKHERVADEVGKLREENEALRGELEEARDTLAAIRAGEVDALVVETPEGQRVYTLEGAEHVYRTLIEEMQEGAVILNAAGTIHYCNRRFAQLVGRALEEIMGQPFEEYVAPADHSRWSGVAAGGAGKAELELRTAEGKLIPVAISTADASAGGRIGADPSEQSPRQ